MRLTTRLKKLERQRQERGECPCCEGKGWSQVFVQDEPGGDLTASPGDRVGCPLCGRVSYAWMLVLDPAAPNPLEAWLAAGNRPTGRW